MFFENLLPKINSTEDMAIIGLGDTRDLLQCRLVCRTFYVLTSRWVWRRVVLNFGPISESIFPTTNESRPFAICNFVLAHPEVSKHVRYLSISACFGRKLDIFHGAPIHTLGSALLAIAPLLQNFRLLGVAIDQPLPWWQALDALFSLPLLRMIWLKGVDCSGVSAQGLKPNPGITGLLVLRCTHLENIYPLVPSLEVFRYYGETEIEQLPPWDKLREVAFETHEEALADHVAESFQV